VRPVAKFTHRPAVATAVFGFLNVLNYYKGMGCPGCTGHEIPELLFFAFPFAAGIVSAEACWFPALVMSIPVVMFTAAWPRDWREWLIEYGMLYLAELGAVVMGQVFRKSLIRPLIGLLRPRQ
jgi:hypothetical protein